MACFGKLLVIMGRRSQPVAIQRLKLQQLEAVDWKTIQSEKVSRVPKRSAKPGFLTSEKSGV